MFLDYNYLVVQWQKYLVTHKSFNIDDSCLEKEIISKALQIAQEAQFFTAQYTAIATIPENLTAILQFWRIKQTESNSPLIRLFGEYIHKKREILIYSNVLCEYQQIFSASGFDLKLVCVAHELFHFIETEYLGDTKKLIVKRYKLNGRKSLTIKQASEIAAHTFAQLFFCLKDIPVSYLEH